MKKKTSKKTVTKREGRNNNPYTGTQLHGVLSNLLDDVISGDYDVKKATNIIKISNSMNSIAKTQLSAFKAANKAPNKTSMSLLR